MKSWARSAFNSCSATLLLILTACGGSSDPVATISSAISGMALNAAGTSMYVANADSNIVQTLNPTLASPTVSTLAGVAGQYGTAEGTTTASAGRFYSPVGITQMSGDLYVADTGNSAIRKLTTAGVITNLVGGITTSGVNMGSANGIGSSALFTYPKGIANDGTDLYVADTGNHTIRRVVVGTKTVSTIAGYAGTAGDATNASGSSAQFSSPYGIAVNPTCPAVGTCDLFVADTGNHTIRRVVVATGYVSTFAGVSGSAGSDNGAYALAKFNAPAGIVTADGVNLYVADSANHVIRKIIIATGTVSTIAGTAQSAGSDDTTLSTSAKFSAPTGLAINAAGTILYVSDQNYTKVRKVDLTTTPATVTTLNATF